MKRLQYFLTPHFMSRDGLNNFLTNTGFIRSASVAKAFRDIDRADFVPKERRNRCYQDYPLSIGHEQTISQPSTVAFMMELLDLQPGHKVLDVGSGSGYTTALIASAIDRRGHVHGVEIIPELVEYGNNNLSKYHLPQASISQAKSGKLGLTEKAPFDRILVSADTSHIPAELADQLKVGGVMVVPARESIWRIRKLPDGRLMGREYPGFLFVPLIRSLAERQQEK